MHSSRMRAVRSSSRLPGGCLPRGCLPRGIVCIGEGVSAKGGVHLPPWTEFLPHACENITFPQLRNGNNAYKLNDDPYFGDLVIIEASQISVYSPGRTSRKKI